ncbi:MAG: hypothetical protein CMB80_05435 [Flammeovirgaceae bacterium]|nr:hypothetical protein [Flammeovirgaceae bacterium]|tara:strand:- start:34 stop:441 length:408 start_codon:yes stop_codon:yes gene_type:complete
MKHHTKTKGDLGVLKAQVSLHEQGYTILQPMTEHSPFDIVAYKDSSFKRIQVKYRKATNGRIEVVFRSNYRGPSGNRIIKVDKSEVDYYCIYCPDTDKCYYININQYNESITLRIVPSKNNQTQGINFAEDFTKI